MERFQPIPRLVVALLLTLAMVGFGQTALAGGEAESPGGFVVPGIEAPALPPQRFFAVTGRIEAVEKSFLLRRTETVGIQVPTLGTLLIEDRGRGQELKQHVGDLVTLIATPRLLDDGKLVLAVQAYEVREPHAS